MTTMAEIREKIAPQWKEAYGDADEALAQAIGYIYGIELALVKFRGKVSLGLVRGGCWPDLKEEEPAKAPKPPPPVIPEFEPGTENPL